jgi:hypothetical protein
MIALALWFGIAALVGLMVGRAIRAGSVDQVTEEIGP